MAPMDADTGMPDPQDSVPVVSEFRTVLTQLRSLGNIHGKEVAFVALSHFFGAMAARQGEAPALRAIRQSVDFAEAVFSGKAPAPGVEG